MAFIYDPGIRLPRSASEFAGTVWLMSWADGPWHIPELMPGGKVYLADVASQTIVWETEVVQACAVPYEHSSDLALEVEARWGVPVVVDQMARSGWCIGWMAQPVRRLDRTALPVRADYVAVRGEELDLTGEQYSHVMSSEFRRRWQMDPFDEPIYLGGRVPIGWFEADFTTELRLSA
jgi:hypothetical protein